MAGARIEVAFADAVLRAAFTRLTPARKLGLLRAIGAGVQHTTRDRRIRRLDIALFRRRGLITGLPV